MIPDGLHRVPVTLCYDEEKYIHIKKTNKKKLQENTHTTITKTLIKNKNIKERKKEMKWGIHCWKVLRIILSKSLQLFKTSGFFDKLYCFKNNCFITNIIINITAIHENMSKMFVR